jgi:hypothetical protein
VGDGAEHGRDQLMQPAGQADEAGHLVGGGLDVGDTGSPQPLELGATPDQLLRRTAPVGGTDRRVLTLNWSGPYLSGRLWG